MSRDAVAIGTFDGVHRGHQTVLAAAQRAAAASGGRSIAYTFDVPPRTLAGGEQTRLLLPPSIKRALLRTWVDDVIEAPFRELRDQTPAGFVHDVLVQELGARSVVVGTSFRFGKERSGDVSALAALTRNEGLNFILVPPLLCAGSAVSSTRIRDLLASGKIPDASDFLGRPPVLRGDVVPGDAIGRTLGFPTANLRLDPRVLLPQDGIYVSRAFVEDTRSLALCYVGRRPTLAVSDVRCEVHLLEPPVLDLLGRDVEVHLYRLLRLDTAFPSLDELRRQMVLDLRDAREAASEYPEASDPDPFGG
jgi:riboflavin kinase/FMN adenylyltransferase